MTATIIIAAYNAERTIERAIASALAEPEVAEVVVVDDASTDATLTRARAQDDGSGRLKILAQPRNLGPAAARNRAIAESGAPWIGVLDADDFFLPGRIGQLLAFAEQADMIADTMWQLAEEAVEGPRRSVWPPLSQPETITFSQFVLSNVARKGRQRAELGFLKPLLRREFLQQHGLRYQESMRLGEDFELYARMLGLGAQLLLTPVQSYVSVVRRQSLSGQHSETDLLHLRDCNMILMHELDLSHAERNALRLHYLSVDCRLQWRKLIRAVKNRKPQEALASFLRPWPVPLYLCQQLAREVLLRSVSPRKPL